MAFFDEPVMDLPARYYPALGEFLFRIAQLEYQLHEVIWFAVGLDYKRGRTLTIGTDFRVLCGMIRTITSTDRWVKNKTLIQEMNSISSAARKHLALRNSIAHGSWQADPKTPGSAVRLHFMKESNERLLPKVDPTLDERIIAKKAGELGALNHRARRLIANLKSVPRSSS